jgi:hypothetical protein
VDITPKLVSSNEPILEADTSLQSMPISSLNLAPVSKEPVSEQL